jgi:hypothetical protein
MTSCIFTVIKNEHQYLDEWIKYHLDLGVDHIFIFEDIDSKTHKEITDNYPSDKVTLNNILTVFSDEKDRQEIIEMKKEHMWVQYKYILNGLLYIQNTYPNKYDWCFVIDNDEFITLENENSSLDDILKIYDGYYAFMLQWKCYGANGFIYKPNYDGKGLIDTYTEEAKGDVKSNWDGIGITKTCYNLNTFKKEHFWNQHQPSNECKWCKSDLRKYRLRPIFKNIYIRHYISKSFEECIWKIYVRREFSYNSKSYKFFFKINPDMEDKKEELLQIADEIINKNKR